MVATWRRLLVVLTVLSCAAVTAPAGGQAQAVFYGAFRIVKAAAGTPSTPQITLPAGYSLVSGSQYQVASRAEYYSFIQGPGSGPVEVSVRWPGVAVAAAVSGKSRLAVTRDPADEFTVRFTVPVTATTTGSLQPTLQIWSYPSGSTDSGLHWRIEHNHPDRRAGPWNQVPWPAAQVRTFLNHMLATEAILRDSGLVEQARQRGHFFSLMGFETNNVLHTDNPPHWHIAYYPGPNYSAPRAHVPHFWMDAAGRTFYNGMDIQGQGRSRFYAGDPAPIHDAAGNLVVTLTIRADGGLDIDPPAGPRYSITATDFTREVTVYRAGQPWRRFSGFDDVVTGFVTARTESLQGAPAKHTRVWSYDPLTGVILSVTP